VHPSGAWIRRTGRGAERGREVLRPGQWFACRPPPL
jgi:hypothetical protein